MDRFNWIWILLGLCMIYQCANPISPSGGPDDNTPPELDVSKSSPNLQTNIKPDEIVLKFDEWVVIKNPLKEIIISPPLEYNPKVSTKGKGVVLKFDDRELLRDSTTYIINFGESIQDLTRGNPFKDFTFVFSTGNQLDKQKVGGNIVDAYTGEPAKGAVVVLYDLIQDSVIFNQKPVYYTSVKDDGSFLIDYLREDTFLIFALIDENRNYYADQEIEKFGYYPEAINTQDTFNNSINFSIYQRTQTSRVISSDDSQRGKLKILTAGDPADIHMRIEPEPIRFIKRIEEDSVIYYLTPADSIFNFYASYGDQIDTIKYKPRKRQSSVGLNVVALKSKEWQVKPSGELDIVFNQPIKAYDLSYWKIIDSTSASEVVSFTSLDDLGINWRIKIDDTRNSTQELHIYPGGLLDIYDRYIEDTIIIKYKPLLIEDLSVINFEISNLDSTQAYIVHLMHDEEIIEETSFQDVSSKKWVVKKIIPDSYSLRIIEDMNKDGKWSVGDYQRRTKPEKILRKKLETLRANWDLDVEIEWF